MYKIAKQNNEVVVTDDKDDSRIVIPSCGQDAIDCHDYLLHSMRHGEKESQAFLARILSGEKPVTQLCDEVMRFSQFSGRMNHASFSVKP